MLSKFSVKGLEEIYTLGFDYSKVLASGETITAATVSIVLSVGTTDPDMSDMLMGVETIDNSNYIVSRQVRYGVAGNTYRIDCLATTSEGNKYLMSGLLKVIEKTP